MVIIVFVAVGIACMRWRTDPSSRHKAHKSAPHIAGTTKDHGKPKERLTKASLRDAAASQDDPALAGVGSPIARRYLAYRVAKGGRLARESHGASIVSSAFAQAWILTSRTDLTAEQQDRLAEFLLAEDWVRWDSMDPKKIDEWARQNLSEEQQAILKRFLAEQKEGAALMEELKRSIRRLEHGDKSDAEILASEMATMKAFFSKDGASESKPPVLTERDDAKQKEHAAYVQTEQAFRFYNLLADRIPLTPEQHEAVYAALREGKQAPVNPYAYQKLPPDRAETAVRADTAWLSVLLDGAQYETYVGHYLAEIEMIHFENSR